LVNILTFWSILGFLQSDQKWTASFVIDLTETLSKVMRAFAPAERVSVPPLAEALQPLTPFP
jgi:hypothetical protein